MLVLPDFVSMIEIEMFPWYRCTPMIECVRYVLPSSRVLDVSVEVARNPGTLFRTRP